MPTERNNGNNGKNNIIQTNITKPTVIGYTHNE
jgi:hypothetical protein